MKTEVHPRPPAAPENARSVEAAESVATRRAAKIVVSVIAIVAAYVSFRHQFGLARLAGDSAELAWTLPVLIDGMIAMASLVMLDSSRRGLSTPWLARVALVLGTVATLVANVAHGWPGGLTYRVISGVAPVVLVIAVELLMGMLRRSVVAPPVEVVDQAPADPEPVTVEEPPAPEPVPRTADEAARLAYEASVVDGKPISERGLASQFNLNRHAAGRVIAAVVTDAVRAYSLTHNGELPPAADLTARFGITAKRATDLVMAAYEVDPAHGPEAADPEERMVRPELNGAAA
ncbi:DUF2637 domain-containing protein [Herbidospora daliensis]|uniref:DUF2637 domain-containing protein n=1 Tax=Herbidospora daliensis TaxID=295585 RepID=UPI000782E6C8|nr:DUF2637 domain-containing protein [Herbidospora daliensis]